MKTKDNQLTTDNGQKQAEPVMQASLQLLPLIMNNIPQAVFWKDRDLVYLGCNQSFADDTGFSSPEEIIGKTDFDMPWKDQAELYRADDRLVMEKGEQKLNYEEPQTTPNGSTIWLSTSKIPVQENGQIVAVLGMYEDITERKKAEEASQDERERFRTILESIRVPTIISRLSDSVVLYANQAMADVSRVDLDKFIGFKTSTFYANPDDQKKLREALQQYGHIEDLEVQLQRTDGSTYWALLSSRIITYEGDTCVLSSYVDITERKLAEARLNESEERYRRLSEATFEGVVIHEKGILFDANPTFATMFGYELAEVIGMAAVDFLTPETREITAQNIRSGYEKPYEVMGLRKDGSTFPVEITGKIIPYQGRMVRVTALRDITERKQLEAQVQEAFERRGYQVQISTEISQEVASASELSDLFERVVTLTKERLGYYYTQLLRYDPAQDAVVLINGYGETGQKMLAGGHQMSMGAGLIGTAAASGKTVLRSTLAEDPDWRPNPLLPDTKGEIAVPIKWQNTVLGVLDVQSNQAGALSDEDRILLEGLCGQIAIAIHSAELVEAVRQNEARLAEALRDARLGNWEYDVEKDIFTFNDQFYSIFHTTAEKAGGYQLSSARYAELFVHPDDMEIVGTEIGKALSSTERVYNATIDHRIRYEDGGIGYIMVQLTVERDENGKITRYYGANQDITERKQAELAVQESQARLTEALRMAKLAYWEHNLATNQFELNDQYYAICHTTAEQEGGYTMSPEHMLERFIYSEDHALINQAIDAGLQSTDRHYRSRVDHRIIYADGSGIGHAAIETNIERDEQGHITRIYGSYQDITERHKAQEEMAERLEEINRLYRAMSHEGWKNYRDTADLPAGFMFDQAGTRPVDEAVLADELFANVPMRVLGGEVVGTLTVANDPQHPTSPEDYIFLQQVSDQIALALESARLFDQTQSALAQSERLFEASRSVAQAADLQELLKATVETLNIPAISRAGLEIFDYNAAGELDRMTLAATWRASALNRPNYEPEAIGRSLTTNEIKVLSLFVGPTPLFINDVNHDERVDPAAMQVAQKQNYRALATLPLFAGTQQIGIVSLISEEPHNFTQDEIRLFTALAPQIATVLENRRQFERAQQQAERESALNVISQKIQSATTVEAVLQIAARELGHALGAPMTIAQLSMKAKQ